MSEFIIAKGKKHYEKTFRQHAVNYYYLSGKSIENAAKNLKTGQSGRNNGIKSMKSNEGIVVERGSGR